LQCDLKIESVDTYTQYYTGSHIQLSQMESGEESRWTTCGWWFSYNKYPYQCL